MTPSYLLPFSKLTDLFREVVLVKGIVQGVGFRPFIYNLAHYLGLTGLVANTPAGVELVVQGDRKALANFFYSLEANAPPLAIIYEIQRKSVQIQPEEKDFIIVSSAMISNQQYTFISPDIAICDACLSEMNDPTDRRYRYPFINCTHCGPRYTIIKDLPYDRPRTTMASFIMCSICQAEYNDPTNRRFHAQPNACPICGPRLWLTDAMGIEIPSRDPIIAAAQALRNGYIIAIKGLGGFHLVVDAMNETAVDLLRVRKYRKEKPLALMVVNLEIARTFVELSSLAEKALTNNQQRPIVLAPIKSHTNLAPSVNLRNKLLGIMLPYTPLHYLLMAEGFQALVMTSGNVSNDPICFNNHEAIYHIGARASQGAIADMLLLHDRDIYLRNDDSVVRIVGGKLRQIRRSRGFVPAPIILSEKLVPLNCPPILATGGQLKNTLCLLRGREAFLSQHIGDLKNLDTLTFFELTAKHLQHILGVNAEIIACDLHPDYLSSKWAQTQKLPLIRIQHHHAHIVTVMAEANLNSSVLALSLDGTGFGPNYTIWGGELLKANLCTYNRLGYLLPFRLPGGNAAIKEPWRIALALLLETFPDKAIELDLPFLRYNNKKLTLFNQMINKGINSPLTSSLGRLFDGIAALAGLCFKVSYEGQAAIELEQIIDPYEKGAYSFSFINNQGFLILDWRPAIVALVKDLVYGIGPNIISARFHRGIIDALAAWVLRMADITGLSQVCLGGGCCMNAELLYRLPKSLKQVGLTIYTPALVPAGDGGLALGQALAAAVAWGQGLLKTGETVLGPV